MVERKGFTRALPFCKLEQVQHLWEHSHMYERKAEIFYCVYHRVAPSICDGGNKRVFVDCTKGYRVTCSDKGCLCFRNMKHKKINALHSKEANKKRIASTSKTVKERYGVDNVMHVASIRDKQIKSINEIYGVSNPMQHESVQKKTRETFDKKYGGHPLRSGSDRRAPSPFRDEAVRDKAKETMRDRYGVANVFDDAAMQDKIKQTIYQKYGVENISQLHISPESRRIVDDIDLFKEFSKDKSFEMVAHQLGMSGFHIGQLARKYDCVDVFSYKKGSVIQDECAQWVSQYVDVEQNTRQIIAPLEIDIWIPSKQLGIEIDGLYYHSENAGHKDSKYHSRKQDIARANGVTLLQIYSDEWIYKKEIVKAIVLRSLGMQDPMKIMARKASIKTLLWADIKDFINTHHMQGEGSPTTHNIGLFHGEQLVSVMSFGKNRGIIGSKDWELVRYCNDPHHNVVGGAQKMFKFALKEFDISTVISYCDRRLFSGHVYKSLGFDLHSDGKPNYYYTNYSIRYPRYKFTKKKLIQDGYDPTMTENEIMLLRGFDRIWDAGQQKWIYKND